MKRFVFRSDSVIVWRNYKHTCIYRHFQLAPVQIYPPDLFEKWVSQIVHYGSHTPCGLLRLWCLTIPMFSSVGQGPCIHYIPIINSCFCVCIQPESFWSIRWFRQAGVFQVPSFALPFDSSFYDVVIKYQNFDIMIKILQPSHHCSWQTYLFPFPQVQTCLFHGLFRWSSVGFSSS